MKKIVRITTVSSSLRTLLKGQLKYMRQYYDVVAISSKEGLNDVLREQEVRGYTVEMTRKVTPFKDLMSLFQLIRILLKEKPYIVHTHTPKAGVLGMVAAWITRVPNRLHTVAGMPLLVATGKKRRMLDIVEKLTYFCATKVYPNSFVMRDIIVSLNLASINKLKVIAEGSTNGIDTSFFTPENTISKEALRRKWGIDNSNFVFVFVGRIVKDKGINELVHTFVALKDYYNDIRLLLVGDYESELDPLAEDVEEIINKDNFIIAVGRQVDVRPFFVIADILAFPSYREGFPNVVMQAGSMGLPSIVTDINGCNEIIKDGVNGKIIPPKNEKALYEAMKWMYEHRNNELKEMARCARPMIVERYEQEKVWEALLKEYNSL
ncbi:glycosyltransferase family 4 protein [Bacteroides cellulosilyticus]|jgi:glycosyltransferase, family 1|uniref:Glycosyltransferase family 4 protein n=3 Tax=Bacteroides cellulosilyticus TaxID=246787 RepID=A0A642PXF6_9BACE|nr:glycosyltransferase family 4 protein [Bacteroides cellulosilyticus]KAA5417542.1 glycosyltransferase family 4 protein [Bacteroides cellulosilyticus]